MAPVKEKFEPVELVSPKRGLTMLLTPDIKIRDESGAVVDTRRGTSAKFRDGHYVVTTSEEWEKIREHSAYTGGTEPKIAFLLSDSSQMPETEGGPRVVTGAQSSTSGRRAAEPIPGYDGMQYAQIRKAVQDRKITDFVAAIVYEQSFRRRRGVFELFSAAMVAASLPTAKAMEAADLAAKADPEVDEANPGDVGTEPEDDTAAAAAALAAREAIDEAIDPEHSEPIPSEGVL